MLWILQQPSPHLCLVAFQPRCAGLNPKKKCCWQGSAELSNPKRPMVSPDRCRARCIWGWFWGASNLEETTSKSHPHVSWMTLYGYPLLQIQVATRDWWMMCWFPLRLVGMPLCSGCGGLDVLDILVELHHHVWCWEIPVFHGMDPQFFPSHLNGRGPTWGVVLPAAHQLPPPGR